MAATTVARELPDTQAKKPPARSYTWTPGDTSNRGTLVTTVGKVVTVYRVREIPGVPFPARGFSLRKRSGGSDPERSEYAVCIDPSEADGRADSCECRGYLRHGHCSHLDALRDLLYSGTLDAPAESPERLGEPLPHSDHPPAEPEPTDDAGPSDPAPPDLGEPVGGGGDHGPAAEVECPCCGCACAVEYDPATGKVVVTWLDSPVVALSGPSGGPGRAA
jgi:hypothetical protein